MANSTTNDGVSAIENISYALLFNSSTLNFFTLNVVVFFEPGYSFAPILPSILPVVGQPGQFTANFSIVNDGGGQTFGLVPFDPSQNQFSKDPDLFTIVTVNLTDVTTGDVSTTKVHHDDANSGDSR